MTGARVGAGRAVARASAAGAAAAPGAITLRVDEIPSPIGVIRVVATDRAVCALDFADGPPDDLDRVRARFPGAALVRGAGGADWRERIEAYFAGCLDALDAIPVDPGGTAFQQRVWRALREVPAGATISYAALAARLGEPHAARAVGLANARNPVALIIPCHRVVGAAGALVGYGGGLWRKRWLLEHERGSIELFDMGRSGRAGGASGARGAAGR